MWDGITLRNSKQISPQFPLPIRMPKTFLNVVVMGITEELVENDVISVWEISWNIQWKQM